MLYFIATLVTFELLFLTNIVILIFTLLFVHYRATNNQLPTFINTHLISQLYSRKILDPISGSLLILIRNALTQQFRYVDYYYLFT